MPTVFPQFTRLPPELRDLVWEHALPEPRVFDICPASTSQRTPAQQGLRFTTQLTEPPPTISAVCRESRSFALRHYGPLTLGSATKYVDLSRDIILLDSCLLERDLLRTLWFMSKIPQIRDNLRSIAFGTSWGAPSGIEHPVLGRKPGKSNAGRILQRLAVFPRLETVVFVLHQEVQVEVRELPRTVGTWDGHLSQNATLYLAGTKPPAVRSILPQPQKALAGSSPHPGDLSRPGGSTLCTVPWTDDKPPLPHTNELLYYPLELEEESDGIRISEENYADWCSSLWPMIKDLRGFKKGLRHALNTGLVKTGPHASGDTGRCEKGRRQKPDSRDEEKVHPSRERRRRSISSPTHLRVPLMVGASLLWRFALPASDTLEHVLARTDKSPLAGPDRAST